MNQPVPAPQTQPAGPPVAWIVTDEAVGHVRQAQALAQAMGLSARHFVADLAPPWSWFAPHWRRGAESAMPRALREAADAERPALVIGCGRRAALVTAWLREAHGAFAIQILDPRSDPQRWDVVIAPMHDRLHGDNVLTVTGALHTISASGLAEAAVRHADLTRIPAPRTTVLVGGSARAQRIDTAWVDSLIDRLAAWHARDGGGFLITTSRRTRPAVVQRLRRGFAGLPARLWTGEQDGENPYLGMLAHAARLVVSPDSANLMTEACATGKPVYVHAPHPVRGKLGELHHELVVAGRVRPLRHEPMQWQPPMPVRETAAIAAEVWRRYRQTPRVTE
jgi:hypothetical protein